MTDVIATPLPLVLYAVVPKTCVDLQSRVIKKPVDSNFWYIGFRETKDEAVLRAQQVGVLLEHGPYVMIEVEFSPLGVACFATMCEDGTHYFAPVLHKIFQNGSPFRDRGAWHFTRDVPLHGFDPDGNKLLQTTIYDIDIMILTAARTIS